MLRLVGMKYGLQVAQAYKREQYRNTIVYIPKCNDASLLLDRAGAQMIELKDESSPVTNGTYDGGILFP